MEASIQWLDPILLIFVNGWLRRLRRVVCPAGRRRCSLELASARRSDLWDRLRKTGSVAPGKMGGHKPKAIAGEHRAWLLRRVKERGGGARARAPARAFGAQSRKARDVLYLGRGTNYPIALERALKLKEISYIHAEGCAAGELKHGPITLIDRCRATSSRPTTACSKKVSNMQEVAARDGKIILSSDPKGAHEARVDSLCKLTLPAMPTTVIRLSYCRGDGQNTSTSREALPSRSPWNDRR